MSMFLKDEVMILNCMTIEIKTIMDLLTTN